MPATTAHSAPSSLRTKHLAPTLGAALFALAISVVACKSTSTPPQVVVVVPTAKATSVADEPPQPRCPPGLILLAGGTFTMGSEASEKGAESDESPAHTVTLPSFCLARTETTVAEYEECEKSGKCPAAPNTVYWNGGGTGDADGSAYCNTGKPKNLDHPINCVEWDHAKAYCAFRGHRLPSEAEFEFALRGTTNRLFPWGDAPVSAQLLNACGAECVDVQTSWGKQPQAYSGDDGWEATAPVGSFPAGASPEGVMDLVGNVMEWTASPYCGYEETNCKVPEHSTRGGGWSSAAAELRSAHRGRGEPNKRHEALGFRCAASVSLK